LPLHVKCTSGHLKMNYPRDLLFIPLKYVGRCRACETRLEEGIRAYWSPSLKKIWCVDCINGTDFSAHNISDHVVHDNRNTTTMARHDKATQSRSVTPWQQLCDYLKLCIEAGAANTMVPYTKVNSQWFLHAGAETLVTGQSDSTEAPGKLSTQLSSHQPSMIYGWPAVVVTARNHKPQITPLFALQIEPQISGNRWVLHAAMEPEFNLAITASSIFDSSITEDINDLLSQGLPFGDTDAFAVVAEQTANLLGLDIASPLNPRRLVSQVGRGQGVYNAAISVVAEWFGYTKMLRKELQQLKSRDDWSTTAASHLLVNGFAPEGSKRPPSGPLAAPLGCNQSQEEILERLRSEPLTVVTGPPGTGKTQLVVNAVANAWLDGHKVLVTSTNNGAVDVAVERADHDVASGMLVRTGNRDIRAQVPDHITAASAHAAAQGGNQAKEYARLKQVVTDRNILVNNLARLDELDAKLLQLVTILRKLRKQMKKAAQTLWGDADFSDPSISSRAIERQANRILHAWFFRRFRARRFRRHLGCLATAPIKQIIEWSQIDQRISELNHQLETGQVERQQLISEVGDPSKSLKNVDQQWTKASLRAVRVRVATLIASGAGHLADFSRISSNKSGYRKAIRSSLNYLQGWACTALSAHSNFPLESGMFDLVIVDEASQCSLAAVLPLAYRAKRLAIIGDPYQLNPIVSISDGHMQEIATQTGFKNDNLRARGLHHKEDSAYSAFEFAVRPQAPVLLNEHYRCHPYIARWFNKHFYKDELTILTDISDTSHRDRAIAWYDVDGIAERENRSWFNRQEAEQTIRQLRYAIDLGYKTVGVVTPFTAQALYIKKLARKHCSPEVLDDIRFESGTAHRFQGDEREAIIFSSVLSPEMSKGGIRWVEKERNLLNVAVSRARRALVVLGHPGIGDLGSPTLYSLRTYLCEEVTRNEDSGSLVAQFRTDSTSEELMLAAMQLGDVAVSPKIEVRGYELDFALLEQGIKLNIEVDGDQHLDSRGRQRRGDISRDRILSNLGWTVLRIPAWRCHGEIDTVIEEIKETRNRLVMLR